MKSFLRTIRRMIPMVIAVVLLNSCLFPEVIDVRVSGNIEEGYTISIFTDSDVTLCIPDEVTPGRFTCLYAGDESARITSNVLITGVDILFLLLLDPLIIQVPASATGFSGSFSAAGGPSGNLVITSGLTSFNADLNTTVTAETGTQFVVLDLPDSAPTSGTYSFSFGMDLPPGTPSLAIKPMFAGKVVANGQTYYPPLLPCVTDFTSIPALNVPLPAGGAIPIPLGQVQGCDDVVYTFGTNGSPDDADGDGVANGDDLCAETELPEQVPTISLGVNRFALVDDDSIFDTTPPQGRGPQASFTIEDTAGCSCEQIIAQLGLGAGHTKYGCSIGVMERWVDLVDQS